MQDVNFSGLAAIPPNQLLVNNNRLEHAAVQTWLPMLRNDGNCFLKHGDMPSARHLLVMTGTWVEHLTRLTTIDER
jgi:hypothetical protein